MRVKPIIFITAAMTLLGVTTAAAAATPQFTQLKWFQIHFCEDIKHLELDQGTAPTGTLPAWGIASDWSAVSNAIHFYRWDLLSGQTIDQADIPISPDFNKVGLRMAVLSKDGRRLLIANSTHEVIMFDIVAKTVVARFNGHRFETEFVAFSSDESHVIALDGNRQAWIWETAGDQASPVQVIELPESPARADLDETTGKLTIVTATGTLVYDVNSGQQASHFALGKEIDIDGMHRPESIALTPNGAAFAADTTAGANDRGDVSLVARDTGALVWSYDLGLTPTPPGWPAMPNSVTGMAFSPNGACLVVGNYADYTVLNPTNGQKIFDQRVNAAGYYLLFSPDGRYLIDTGGCDVQVYQTPPACLN